MGELICFNCGLWNPKVLAQVHFKPKNSYKGESRRWLPFCNEECARQTLFLQLPTRSTPDTITRFLGGKPITYAQFKAKVPIEVRERAARAETPSQSTENKEAKMGENEVSGLPHADPNFRTIINNLRGRPRKWKDNAERMRAYRQEQV